MRDTCPMDATKCGLWDVMSWLEDAAGRILLLDLWVAALGRPRGETQRHRPRKVSS